MMLKLAEYVTPQGVHCKGCARLLIARHCSPEAGYCDLYLRMADGSEHSTPMCRDCAEKVTLHDALALYFADVVQWRREGYPEDWLARQAVRVPIEVLGVDRSIHQDRP